MASGRACERVNTQERVQAPGVCGLVGALALAVALLPAPASAELDSASEILACLSNNSPRGDDLRSISLVTRDRAGATRVLQADMFGRRTQSGHVRLVMRFTEPEDLADSSVMVVQHADHAEVWTHTVYGRTQISQGEQAQRALFGTGMSYEDFLYVVGSARSDLEKLERVADATVAGRSCYVLESTPAAGSSSYERIVTAIDKQTCVPLEVKLYERDGSEPRRVLTSDPAQVYPVGDVWIPHNVVLRDTRDGRESVLRLESVQPLPPLPDEFFSPAGLGRFEPEVEVVVRIKQVEGTPEPVRP